MLAGFRGASDVGNGSNREVAMSTRIEDRPVTADELLRMPDQAFRRELVRGVVRERPFMGAIEGRLAAVIGLALLEHVQRYSLGVGYGAGTGFQLARDPDTVRAPTAAFLNREKAEVMAEVEGYVPGAPDLAVEVVTTSDVEEDTEERVRSWLDAGTRMVVVVDPWKRWVTVYHSRDDIRVLGEGDVVDGGDVVPGWTLPAMGLFP
jgi:Uma2 family endonuclease